MTGWVDYERHHGLGLAELVRRGEVSAGEVLEAAIARVDARNPAINAVVSRFDDQARAAIHAGLPGGPFRGVPYLLKDLGVLLAGTVLTYGSRLFADHVADHDSEITVRLRRAGLVIFGKTNTPELGIATSTEGALAAHGVDAFAVATVPEAVELRERGIGGLLTVLTYFAPEETDAIVRHDLSPVVFTPEAVDAVAARAEALGRPARVWVKVDTGLGRIGVPFGDAPEFARRVARQPRLRIEGLLSTLAENPERNALQAERLRSVRDALADLGALPLSLASTDGILSQPACHLDVVRPGIVLLGVVPRAAHADTAPVGLMAPRPVVTWKARVAYVKRVPRGEQVGYGVRPPLEREATIATLAIGWADGYPQAAQGAAHALLGGRRCSIVFYEGNNPDDAMIVGVW